jgi:hypothetical protein
MRDGRIENRGNVCRNFPSSIFERGPNQPSPSRYCRKARHIRLSAVRDKVLLSRTAFTPRAGECAGIFPVLGSGAVMTERIRSGKGKSDHGFSVARTGLTAGPRSARDLGAFAA